MRNKIFLGLAFLFVACAGRVKPGNRVVSTSEYATWVNENIAEIEKLSDSKNFGDISFELKYIPAEIRALREVGSFTHPNYLSVLNESRKLEVYQIRISNNTGINILNMQSKNYPTYDQRVKYFAFEIQKNIKLTIGKSTIPCSMCHFERTFETSPYTLLNIAFDKSALPKSTGNPVITIDDTYFNIGKVNLGIEAFQLNKIPNIKA